jgi:hypothetical protein
MAPPLDRSEHHRAVVCLPPVRAIEVRMAVVEQDVARFALLVAERIAHTAEINNVDPSSQRSTAR